MRPARLRTIATGLVLAVVGTLAGAAVGPVSATTTRSLDQQYELRVVLDAATGRFEVAERIEVTNRASRVIDHVDLGVVARALGYFELEGPVTVDGEPVEAAWTTTMNLRVPLGDVPEGGTVEIGLRFVLEVGSSPEAFGARLSRDNGVISAGQWFPIISPEHEVYGLGDPQVTFSADRIRLDLATTGPLPRDAVACPGMVSAPDGAGTAWTCEVEDARDLSFVVNSAFVRTDRDVDGIALRVYTQTVDGSATADLATVALRGLSEAFGPYPWPDLVLAEVGVGGGFSMEYPRAIHLTRGKVTDPYVVYHEVAHQWFYGQVGNDQQSEPWLDEAFADFSARLLLGIESQPCSALPIDSPVFAWEAGPTTGGDWTGCTGYFETVFYRGAEFLNAIRAAMGDDAFFEAIRGWVDEHRHGFVTARDLLLHLQSASEADLAPIYRDYLADLDATLDKRARGLTRAG